jgi:hypothetical protein
MPSTAFLVSGPARGRLQASGVGRVGSRNFGDFFTFLSVRSCSDTFQKVPRPFMEAPANVRSLWVAGTPQSCVARSHEGTQIDYNFKERGSPPKVGLLNEQLLFT